MFKHGILICLIVVCTPLFSQHETHAPYEGKDSAMVSMSHAFSLHLPMNRNGSGTSWMPDASNVYGHGAHYKKWMFMFQGNLFLRYTDQDIFYASDKRGGEKADIPGWLMLMAQRKTGRNGLFSVNTMLSPEPFTIGPSGYPLLFQSGETYKGQRLVNRQHPHDLISGLSIAYAHSLSKDIDLVSYLGYPGEPALGPVTFMHRLSAMNNPDAPLGHHWQDATHISYGVGTLGIRYSIFKIEGSVFTGREADENRYDLDRPKFDSYSYRLSANPNEQFALQFSRGYLKSPEVFEPDQDIVRSTASIAHHLPLAEANKYLATSFIWGLNKSDREEHSFLLESNLQLNDLAVYGRCEYVQKEAADLGIYNDRNEVYGVGALTLGSNRIFYQRYGFNMAAGFQGTVFVPAARIQSVYGKMPVSAEIYLRLYPGPMHMHDLNKKQKHE